jgi:cysteinyl-tRNA synthetase
MIIKLYNTLTRQEEDFYPADVKNVRMYVCGPTVYDRPHIGNARAVIVYDVLYRLLSDIYGAENITYVRNITDVDDKINHASKERKISIQTLTTEITEIFHRNMEALNCFAPTIEPKATEHISEMIAIIERLLVKGIAYIASNKNVYFNVLKCQDYGTLAGRDIETLKAGARIEIDANKINPEDFVLWKPADEGDDPSSIFDSPWGRGRPGWHIECSAMSSKYLGNDFDIHGGGADLMFPHHTNEIAQSCSAFPGSNFAKYWVHNGFVTVKGEKMSKSLGNFITVEDLLNNGVEGEVIRYVLLATNYHKPLDWNDKSVSDARKILDTLSKAFVDIEIENIDPIRDEEILSILSQNLNTAKAFAYMIGLAKSVNKAPIQKIEILGKLKFAGDLLGFSFKKSSEQDLLISLAEIEEKIKLREEARQNKNWLLSDKIREDLKEKGILIEDHQEGGPTWRKVSR